MLWACPAHRSRRRAVRGRTAGPVIPGGQLQRTEPPMSGTLWGRACTRLLAPGLIALAGSASANPPATPLPPGAALPGLSRPVEAPGRLPALAGQEDKDKNGKDKNGKKRDDNGASNK